MPVTNSLKYEESTEIMVDSEVEAPAAGWTLNYVSVNRVGNLVAVHIEATNGLAAAAPVCTLPGDFCPAATLTDQTGLYTLTAAGLLSFSGSTVAAARRVVEFVYQAGLVSP